MSRDGSGTYNLPAGINPVVSGTTITDEWANQTLNDVASALTQSLSKDGQTVPTADLQMGNRKHTNVSDPTERSHYASLGVVQDNRQSRVASIGGTGNAITGTMSIGNITAYSPGMIIVFTAASANTGAVTINIDSVGAKSLVSKDQTALVANDLLANKTYMAYYNDNLGSGAFVLLSETSNSASSPAQIATSGWIRPASGDYPAITFSGTNVTIPAGEGYIISPGTEATPGSVSVVSWAGGTYALSNVTPTLVSAYTTLCINSAGQLVQIAGKPSGAALRNYIILGYVNHIDGTVRASSGSDVHLSPEIWLDDGYQAKDTTNLLQGVLVSGGRVTVNGTNALKMDVANGTALMPGGAANTPDAPNTISITGGSAISFFPYHGTLPENFAASTDTVDVTNYNPAQADSAPSALTAGYFTFHRLYWLLGQFVLVYGQNQYNPPGSTFEHAVALLAYDDSKYKIPLVLSGATYLCAILVQKSTASIDNGTTGAIICKGKETFGIGSSAGFTDAPSDSNYYGRRNTAWAKVLPEADPSAVGDMNLTEDAAGATTSIDLIKDGATEWVRTIYDTVGDEYRIESYVASVLDTTPVTVDLTDGSTHLLAGSTVDGVAIGNVTCNDGTVADGAMVLFDGTGGATVKEGSVPGNVVTHNVMTSESDNTAGRVLVNGASYGLSGTAGLLVPVGTTAQRPGSPTEGQFRKNSTTGKMEVYINAGWASLLDTSQVILPYNYLSGLTMTKGSNQVSVAAGRAMDSANAVAGYLNSSMAKLINSGWSSGTGNGGRAAGVSLTSSTWYAVHLLIKANGETDVGFDTSATAINLLADANVVTWAGATPAYRRIGWVYYETSDIANFKQVGDEFIWTPRFKRYIGSGASRGTIDAAAPPNTFTRMGVNLTYPTSGDYYAGMYLFSSDEQYSDYTSTAYTLYYSDAFSWRGVSYASIYVNEIVRYSGSAGQLKWIFKDSGGNEAVMAGGVTANITASGFIDTRGK